MIDGDLLTQAWELYRNQLDNRAESVRCGLRVKCPGHSDADYVEAARLARDFDATAAGMVAANARELHAHFSLTSTENPVMDDLVTEFQSRFPQFPEAACRKALGWIWYWHHLR